MRGCTRSAFIALAVLVGIGLAGLLLLWFVFEKNVMIGVQFDNECIGSWLLVDGRKVNVLTADGPNVITFRMGTHDIEVTKPGYASGKARFTAYDSEQGSTTSMYIRASQEHGKRIIQVTFE